MSEIYAMHRPAFVSLLRDLRGRLQAAPADKRHVWRRRLRAAQKDAKRFREECSG